MAYKITVKQEDITNNNKMILFNGIVDNFNEFDYTEKNTNIKTNIYVDDELFELIRYGDLRTMLHLEVGNSYAKVIDKNGQIDLDIRLIKVVKLDNMYSYEYQIIQDGEIVQHFIFTLNYKTLFN